MPCAGGGTLSSCPGAAQLNRRPEDLLNMRGPRREHHEPVETKGDAARLRHDGERIEEILVDGIGVAVNPLPLRHFRLKALPLHGGIGQLSERVGKLDAADVKLETLGKAVILLQ